MNTSSHSFDDIIHQLQSQIEDVKKAITAAEKKIKEKQMAAQLQQNDARKKVASDLKDYTPARLGIDVEQHSISSSENDVKELLYSLFL